MNGRRSLHLGFWLSLFFATTPLVARDLTFEERVRAQDAIERVYYAHQLGATKPFEEVVPRRILEKKVTTYLKQSAALESIFRTPVTAEMLEHELDRIARQTRMPERLSEIYAALGNDAFLVEECFARPSVVDRLLRSFQGGGEPDRSYEAWWNSQEASLPPLSAPVARPGRVLPAPSTQASVESCPTADTWTSNLLAKIPHDSGRSGVWTGALFIAWGSPGTSGPAPGYRYDPVIDDWTPMSTVGAPSTRDDARLIWTGQLVIAWSGKIGLTTYLASGARYDPVLDQWLSMSAAGAPTARPGVSAVWTGSYMIVWGGGETVNGSTQTNAGGRYDPELDTWTPTTVTGAPPGRTQHVAVWTGSRMIVFGGFGPHPTFPGQYAILNSGGLYDPTTDSWQPTSLISASGLQDSRAVWTGTLMLVWGGKGGAGAFENGGRRYNPATNTWTNTSLTNAPFGRNDHTAVWTGSRMLVWGGSTLGGVANTGGSYDPATDSWTAISTTDAPAARTRHVAVWAGTRMIVFGGGSNTGGRYEPGTDSWTPTTTYGAPKARAAANGVWTGSVACFWGGTEPGGRYDPVLESWSPMASIPSTLDFGDSFVWTGEHIVVWGPAATNPNPGTGWRYNPQGDAWSPMATAGAPVGRSGATLVWSGQYVIAWGGNVSSNYPDAGGRYDPAADGWQPTSVVGAPLGRNVHAAVWNGSRMIVWGGRNGFSDLNTGGRYDPVTDTWQATTTVGAPTARAWPSAVWTGTRVVFWGGFDGALGNPVNSGGRYDPVTDTWQATTLTGAPSARAKNSAVWTGNRMLIYGGYPVVIISLYFGDLRSYDPAVDTWTLIGAPRVPPPRSNHAAVWTGSEMFVWGGRGGADIQTDYESGGIYVPADDDADGQAGRCDNCPLTANALQADSDVDAIGNLCDNCVSAENAGQLDSDHDGAGDACDCQPNDPAAGRPGEVGPVTVSKTGASIGLSWSSAGLATTYSVTRGDLAALTSSEYGPCAADGIAATTFDDATVPTAGTGFFYLVQANNATCGAGSLGWTSGELQRVNANPAACDGVP